MKRVQKRFLLPIIGHFADKDVRFDSIMQASDILGINHYVIFDNIIGKIKSGGGVYWEYEDGKNWIKYKSRYLVRQDNYMRLTGFNG